MYIQLYFNTISNDPDRNKQNCEYLENMVVDTVRCIPYVIWPGLMAASLIFSLYLFDIAWDTPDNKLGVPITLVVLNTVFFAIICIVFFLYKSEIKNRYITTYLSASEKRISGRDLANRLNSTAAIGHNARRNSEVELRASTITTIVGTEIVENPLIDGGNGQL
jgi:hypothetical protein